MPASTIAPPGPCGDDLLDGLVGGGRAGRRIGIEHGASQFSGAERSSLASRAETGVPRLPQAVRM